MTTRLHLCAACSREWVQLGEHYCPDCKPGQPAGRTPIPLPGTIPGMSPTPK